MSTQWLGDTLEITQQLNQGTPKEFTRWLKLWEAPDGTIRGLVNSLSTGQGYSDDFVQDIRNGLWSEGFTVPTPWEFEEKYVDGIGFVLLIKTRAAAPFLHGAKRREGKTEVWLYIPASS